MAEKKKNELVEKDSDVDLATFAGNSIKVSVDPERAGEIVGEIFKRATKEVVKKVLKR